MAPDGAAGWLQWQRIFQISTWAHCAILAGLIAFQAAPATLRIVARVIFLVTGHGRRAVMTLAEDARISFPDALERGLLQVRKLCACVYSSRKPTAALLVSMPPCRRRSGSTSIAATHA